MITLKKKKITRNVVDQINNVSQLLKLAGGTWVILIHEQDDAEGRVMKPSHREQTIPRVHN